MKKKKFYSQLVLQIAAGLFLGWLTWEILPFSNDITTGQAGWPNFVNPNAGIGYFGLLMLVFGLDIFWVIFFVLWLARRKLHMKSKDKTLYLP